MGATRVRSSGWSYCDPARGCGLAARHQTAGTRRTQRFMAPVARPEWEVAAPYQPPARSDNAELLLSLPCLSPTVITGPHQEQSSRSLAGCRFQVSHFRLPRKSPSLPPRPARQRPLPQPHAAGQYAHPRHLPARLGYGRLRAHPGRAPAVLHRAAAHLRSADFPIGAAELPANSNAPVGKLSLQVSAAVHAQEGQRPGHIPAQGNALGSGQQRESSPERAGQITAVHLHTGNRAFALDADQRTLDEWEMTAQIVAIPHFLPGESTLEHIAGRAINCFQRAGWETGAPAALQPGANQAGVPFADARRMALPGWKPSLRRVIPRRPARRAPGRRGQ